MEKDILSEVIETEKEIQKLLESEKAKAHEWLKNLKKEYDEAFAREEKKMEEEYREATEKAIGEAELKASEIVGDAEKKYGLLGQVPDTVLKKIVTERLRLILPG